MKLSRRRSLHLAVAASALAALRRSARAQAYPARPVRILVGFGSGSAFDILARLIGQWLSERMGQPFVIENRGGAGGSLATEAAVRAAPDVLVVHPSFPAATVPEFIAYARANPGKVNFASAGIGSVSHMAGELFKTMAGVDLVHVPYRSLAPALTDLIGGQVQAIFATMPPSIANVRAGKLRALAVTSTTRFE